MRRAFSLLFLLLLARPGMAQVLRVGEVSAAPGTKVSGSIRVPGGSDAPVLALPVTVIHGRAKGPVLALIAGTHGYEYASILALPRLLPRLDPAAMTGSVILVHMANPAAFYGRRIYVSSDGKNLNRVYPGRADGTLSDRIAFAITTEVIDRATHLIDMHSGDGNESLRPYSYWMTGGDAAVDAASRELTLAYGLDHIVIDTDRPKDPANSRYTAMTAILRGKPAITTESGGMGGTDDASVDAHVRGALSVMRHLGILDAPSIRVENPVWFDRTEVLAAPATGVWEPVLDQKDSVAAGSLVGRVRDPFGAVLAEVRAPFGGEMLYVVRTPPVTAGEPVGFVARAKAETR